MKTIRTFIAIPLPAEVMDALRHLQTGLKKDLSGFRWTRPDNIHLTLRFLGEIDRVAVEKVGQVLHETLAAQDPLELVARGLGVFPTIRRARVLWTGLDGQTDRLARMVKGLDEGLSSAGFSSENRPYRGHLTLARARRGHPDPLRLAEIIGRHGRFASRPFTTREVLLYKSDLRPQGPVYTRLTAVALTTQPLQ